jgi:hypothetical protein
VALAVGDQQAISHDQWTVFTRTGVNHLISISGLHITMLSGLAFGLVLAIWRRIPRLTGRLAAVKAAAIAGLFVACGYALLAGFAVPAQRTDLQGLEREPGPRHRDGLDARQLAELPLTGSLFRLETDTKGLAEPLFRAV